MPKEVALVRSKKFSHWPDPDEAANIERRIEATKISTCSLFVSTSHGGAWMVPPESKTTTGADVLTARKRFEYKMTKKAIPKAKPMIITTDSPIYGSRKAADGGWWRRIMRYR